MSFVLDASMTLAWVFPDEANARTEALRDSLVEHTAFVPALWSIEVANALLVATRRGRMTEREWPDLLRALAALPIETDTQTSARALADTLDVARDHSLSAYDAAYLELALRRRLPLATLDRSLAAAAAAASVEVIPAPA